MNSVLSSKSSTLICGIVYSTMRGASNSFIPKNTTFSGLFDCPIKRNESNNPHYNALSAQPLQHTTHPVKIDLIKMLDPKQKAIQAFNIDA